MNRVIVSLRSLALASCLPLLGCQACGSAASQEPGPRETPEPSASGAQTPPPRPDPEPPPTSTSPPPTVPGEPAPAVTIEATRTERGVTVTLTNATREPLSFASALVLEQRSADDAWTSVTTRGHLTARLDAERALPDCAELVAGASLELPFDGIAGPDCAPCAPPTPGTYRVVVTSCNGTGRTESAPFTVTP